MRFRKYPQVRPVFALRALPGTTLRPSGNHVAAPREARRTKRGGARRDRTADLVIANDALSQLSYGPIQPTVKGLETASNRGHLQAAPRPSQERRNRCFAGNFPCLPLTEPIFSLKRSLASRDPRGPPSIT